MSHRLDPVGLGGSRGLSRVARALALALVVAAASACGSGGDDPGSPGGSGGVVGTGGTGGDPGTGGTGGDPGTGGTGGDPGTGGTGGDPGTGGTGGEPAGPVVRVEIDPPAATLVEHDRITLTATAYDAEDREVAASAVGWRSSDPSVVHVTNLGDAIAIGAGTATITATVDGVEGEAIFTVTAGVVVDVFIDGLPGRYLIGETVALLARPLDSQGRVLVGRAVDWTSSDQTVATVDALGTLIALAPGVATISAEVEGVVGQAQVEVYAPPAGGRMSLGFSHSCYLDDSGAAWCWGANDDGQLGNGSFTESASPVAVSLGLTYRSIAAAEYTTCGVTEADQIHCWGSDFDFQLGGGGDSPTPVLFSSGPWASVGTMNYTTCAIDLQGHASCWGFNSSDHEFGNGTVFSGSPTPVPVLSPPGDPPLSFVEIQGGVFHACGLTDADGLYCWGFNSSGQVGVGHTNVVTHAMPLFAGQVVDAFGVSGFASCATAGGTSYCWGDGSVGQLGNGNWSASSAPSPITSAGAPFTAFAGGEEHMCALDAVGAAWCWGDNLFGQLGSAVSGSNVPVAVSGGLTFTSIYAGGYHTCGITDTGAVYCWGSNLYGQLGIGTFEVSVDTPTLVPL
ncbi:MAG TPA: Ig-like domain-containing protein [Vulgatibacter sp.]|nr:Ig-like domain-containing protein [Vulgatibacter sp.]